MSLRRSSGAYWAVLALAVCLAGSGGCSVLPRRPAPPRGSADATMAAELADVQVRQYRGKRLGAIEDFRENSIKGPQVVDRESYRLAVAGLVDEPLSLTYDEVVSRPAFEKVVTLNCVEGWSVDVLWEGVKLSDLIADAGADSRANTVIFRCADGYSTSLPLEFVEDRDILLAYKMNGVELPADRGFPFQVVAEDKWGYKWAKWVTAIELGDDPEFEGYWERRGYDNDADLPSARK